MSAYVELQEQEFAAEEFGYTATRHQREVGAGYFDSVLEAITGEESSTLALRARPRKRSSNLSGLRRECGRGSPA